VELRQIRRKKGELNLPLVYLGVAGTGLLLLYFLYIFKRLPYIPCVFKSLTGYPCPTCGSTRVLLDLLHFNIAAAFRWNPLIFLAVVMFVAWVAYGFYMTFSGKKIQVTLSARERRFLVSTLAVLLVLNWLYLVIFKI
jgi:hypothetical protein